MFELFQKQRKSNDRQNGPPASRAPHRPQVVVIGGGFGGLNAVRELRGVDADVTLIDRNNYHLFQPLLYQVAAAALSPGDIAEPLRGIFKNQKNTRVIMDEAASIDAERRQVLTRDGLKFPYDYLILASGSRHHYFGNDDWEQHAGGLKNVSDALRIRENILYSFEQAEKSNDPELRSRCLTFVVVGGGPTGVEMAGAIAEIARRTMREDFRNINPAEARIVLLEAGPRLLPMYPEELSERAKQDLEGLGVEVRCDCMVRDVRSEGVLAADQWFEASNLIWAAGNKTRGIADEASVEQDRAGRIYVNDDLSLPERPEVFAIGDTAHAKDADGNPLPGIAPVAVQSGRYAAGVIRRELKQGFAPERRRPFRYKDRGFMSTIGRASAVAVIGGMKFRGLFAWLLWSFVHVLFLIGFRNKVSVMLNWSWHYITFHRAARLITNRSKPAASAKRPQNVEAGSGQAGAR